MVLREFPRKQVVEGARGVCWISLTMIYIYIHTIGGGLNMYIFTPKIGEMIQFD